MAAKNVKLKITLLKSPISHLPAQRRTVAALGLKRLHASVIKDSGPAILGMINTISHLVKVEEVKT